MLVRLGFQIVFCLVVALPAALWSADIRVNERLGTNNPAIARQTSGETFVVWDSGSIVGQRLDAEGQLLSNFDLGISSTSLAGAALPDVAMNDSGQVVVVWHSRDDNGTDLDVLGRLFTFDTLESSDVFRINLEEEGAQVQPQVVIDETGQFVVAYQSFGIDGDAEGIVMRRFDATGQPLDNGQVVNPSTAGGQLSPALARGASGELAVSWIDDAPGSNASLFLRLFDADGTPTSGAIQVADGAISHALAISDQGNILAAWEGTRISSRLFDALGNPLTGPLDVDEPDQDNRAPAVAALPSGDFQVVWVWDIALTPDLDILGRIVESDGTLQGSPFQVTEIKVGPQNQPDIVTEGFGVAVAFVGPSVGASSVWTTCLTAIRCTEVFTNGFETGDTTRWTGGATSGTTP